MIATKTEQQQEAKGKAVALGLVVMALMAACLLLTATPAHAKTFTVNHTGDAEDSNTGDKVCDVTGFVFACSLRAAIQEANATGEADTVKFNIHPTDINCDDAGVCTISPDTELPEIGEPLTINGYSQPDAKPNTNKGATNNAVLKIELDGIAAGASSQGLEIEAPNTLVKGLVINRFGANGILLDNHAAGSKVQGNFIGTNPAGTADRGNAASGVFVTVSNTIIGGRYPSQRNVISGNEVNGVYILLTVFEPKNNTVQGNRIGTNKNGNFDLGNDRHGVEIRDASDNLVGGSRGGQANVIAFNDLNGVSVENFMGTSTGNRILRNIMSDNLGLGIDLGNDGPTPNDPGDADLGPNNLQNFPEITSVTSSGNSIVIKGNLESTANRTFSIRFFQTAFGQDEGFHFLGKKSVSTNSGGEASFKFTTSNAIAGGGVTATATDPQGNTSEFSEPVG